MGQDLLTPLNFDKLCCSTICGCSKQKGHDIIRSVYNSIFNLNIYLQYGFTLHTYTYPKIITNIIFYIFIAYKVHIFVHSVYIQVYPHLIICHNLLILILNLTYTTIQKFGVSKVFWCFWKSLLCCIYLIKGTVMTSNEKSRIRTCLYAS